MTFSLYGFRPVTSQSLWELPFFSKMPDAPVLRELVRQARAMPKHRSGRFMRANWRNFQAVMHIDKDGDTTVCKAVILNNGEYLKFVQYQRRGEERLAIEETEWKVWLALFEHLNDLINELERELGVHVERQ